MNSRSSAPLNLKAVEARADAARSDVPALVAALRKTRVALWEARADLIALCPLCDEEGMRDVDNDESVAVLRACHYHAEYVEAIDAALQLVED